MVTFSKPSPDVIVSDTGFSVQLAGRSRVRYAEGDKSLLVESEIAILPTGLIIYPKTITNWLPPNAEELIDESKRNEIVENIRSACAFAGFEIDVL